MLLPGSSIYFMKTRVWPLRWQVKDSRGKWLTEARYAKYMFGLYDTTPPEKMVIETPKQTVVLHTHIIYLYYLNHEYHFMVETLLQI